MLKLSPAAGTVRTGLLLVVALAGCAQVFNIEDWTDTSSGTGGVGGSGWASSSAGPGGQSSASTGPGGGQTSSQSASTGTGGAAQASSSAQSSSAATGGSTATSTVQSSSVGPATGTGGSTTGLEDCTNSVDDDNDGHIDCADSDCVAFTCVPPVPSDWKGWVKIYTGPGPLPPPGCGEGWATVKPWLTGTLSASDATCACACQAATGGNCNIYLGDDHLNLYNNTTCTQALAQVTPSVVDTCTLLSTSSITRKSVSFQANTPASGGSCVASGGIQSKPPATFDQMGLTCEDSLEGAGCTNSTDVCVPAPAAPFNDSLCIYKPVADPLNTACPAGYTKLGSFYGGIQDDRGCAPCTCGAASGSQWCPMVARIYTSSDCTTNLIATLSGDGVCQPTNLANSIATYYTVSVGGPPMGGQCPPSAPTPTGEAYGINGAVVCCLP